MSPPTDLARILETAAVAVRRHHGQLRKYAPLPYSLHPLRVAALVAGTDGPPGSDREACLLAALLHDTIEDTAWTVPEIERDYGPAVASVVAELTQDKTLPKEERRRLMIAHCATMSPSAKWVKLADRLDNMREMGSMPPDFIERYCREASEMLKGLSGACPPLEAEIRARIEAHSKPRP
jgi:guanosine-3',5'-bis(diphosphate) 3'-pyrophosphohydrolase